LIIAIASFALTRPFIVDGVEMPTNEVIIIIDASASMLARQGGETRFERAVNQAIELGSDTINNGEYVTVILAADIADPILPRAGGDEGLIRFNAIMRSLIQLDQTTLLPMGAGFFEADIDGAMTLTETMLEQNLMAEVYLFTATSIENAGRINIIDVSRMDIDIYGDAREWNAAILNVTAQMIDNFYRFTVEAASFNRDIGMRINLRAFDARGPSVGEGETGTVSVSIDELFIDNEIVTIRFDALQIYSFRSVHVYVEADDSFAYDNEFWVFSGSTFSGGTRDANQRYRQGIRILYVTPRASVFYRAALVALTEAFAPRWDISFSIMSMNDIDAYLNGIMPNEYDLYIFEYQMPERIPTDGAVLLITGGPSFGRSTAAPLGSGLVFNEIHDRRGAPFPNETNFLHPGAPSQAVSNINPNNIIVNRFREVVAPAEFETHLYFRDIRDGAERWDPVFLVKNTPEARIAVKAYATLYSDLGVSIEFPLFMYNLMNIFFPVTLARNAYDIGDTLIFAQTDAVVNEIRPNIIVNYDMPSEESFNTVPYNIPVNSIGIHSITQFMVAGTGVQARRVVQNFFVRVPASQSDFTRVLEIVPPEFPEPPRLDYDIYIFLGLALFALLFIERLLAMSKSF